MDLDDDRPNAGTACAVCRNHDHFCPAVAWAKDRPEVGICAACRDGVDCSFFLAIRERETRDSVNPFQKNLDVGVSSPGRSVPRSEWKKEEVEVQVAREDYTISEETKAAIIAEPNTMPLADIAKKYMVSRGSVYNFRKKNIVAPKVGSARLGGIRKDAEREIAKEALLAGKSIRQAALASGLSDMTVQKVRKELGLLGTSKVATDANGKEHFVTTLPTTIDNPTTISAMTQDEELPRYSSPPEVESIGTGATIVFVERTMPSYPCSPVALVIADLLVKRNAIDHTIALLREMFPQEGT